MQGEQPNYANAPGIRKDILSFKESDLRRKRLFICLKMLGILPCHPNNQDRCFNISKQYDDEQQHHVYPDKMMYIKPKKIHDELISSHATCCEHQTPYFAHYHRNLAVYTQFQLNYADQFLRFNNDEPQKHKDQWAAVIKQYRDLIEQLKKDGIFQQKVMCHYWNPTNFKVNQYPGQTLGINYPIELYPKNPDKYQLIDKLFLKVNQHLPWQINIRTRFYQMESKQQYKKKTIEQLQKDLPDFVIKKDLQFKFQEQELQIISGKSNPRSRDLKTVQNFFDYYVRKADPKKQKDRNHSITNLISTSITNQNHDFFTTEGNNQVLRIQCLNQDQYNINYGSQRHNAQWLDLQDRKELKSRSLEYKGITPHLYNIAIPYYQFAQAYKKSGTSLIASYFGGPTFSGTPKNKSLVMENSHNTMHNNNCFVMNDSSYSVVNLIFYLYHSWIDYQLEVKIRQLNTQKAYNRAVQQLQYKRERTIYDIFKNLDKQDKQDKKDKEQGCYTVGSYRIPEWVDPKVGIWRWTLTSTQKGLSNLQYTKKLAQKYFQQHKKELDPNKAFKYSFSNTGLTFKDFVLATSTKNIRRSDQLNEIYQPQYQVQCANSPYSYFKSLKKYSFDYFYQIYDPQFTQKRSQQENKLHPLIMNEPNGPILPSYLQKIVEDVDYSGKKIVDYTKDRYHLQTSKGAFIKCIFTPLPIREKLFQSQILAIGSYSSLIKSGNYYISIKFLKNIEEIIKSNKKLKPEQYQYICQGFIIKHLSIFSKGQNSKSCPKCTPQKKFWIDAEYHMRNIHPEAWRAINLYLISKDNQIYSSKLTQKENQDNLLKTSEIVGFSALYNDFNKFTVIQGAEQVQFYVSLNPSNQQTSVSVKLDLEYYCMLSGTMHGVVSKTLYSLQVFDSQKKCSFNKIIDLASSSVKSSSHYFNKFYFKTIKGEVTIGDHTKSFNFHIRRYHRLVRYHIELTEINEKCQDNPATILVSDADYNMKFDYYLHWQDDI